MLLTITYQADTASDLGFLLHKNPKRPQAFSLSHGMGYVFYPENEEMRCTAALLLDIDPIDLARGKVGSREGGLFDYVNDRPYVSSSFMSNAISRVFGTAMAGRCEKRPDLVMQSLPLAATIVNLPCKGDTAMLSRVFEPLGYSVSFEETVLDEKHPEWGESKYVDLTITGTVRLQQLLRHLYVLMPVFDRKKHYWIGRDEVDKLLRNGEGWLEEHPEKQFIASRYVGNRRSLARIALDAMKLDRMDEGEAGSAVQEDAQEETDTPKAPSLNKRRLATVVQALKDANAKTVIDLGCGEGNLLALLAKDSCFTRIAGMDVSWSSLERASKRLNLDRPSQKERITLFQGSVTYRDERFAGYDAACVVEVIEHLDAGRLNAFAQVVFGAAKPQTIVLTTPNVEYNENYVTLPEGELRHSDHRFEWTRRQFTEWAHAIAAQYGYSVQISEIGDVDENLGTPTQMGVFTRCE